MKHKSWRSDWAIGAIVVVLFSLLWQATPLIRNLESKAYDWAMSAITRDPSPRIAVIGIDQTSLDNIGRWPWSRDVHAKLIDQLKAGGAAQIISMIFFTEAERDRGLDYLERLQQQVLDNPAAYPEGFAQSLQQTLDALQVDQQLARSIAKAGNVLLPMMYSFGAQAGSPTTNLPEFVLKTEIDATGDVGQGKPRSVINPVSPIAPIGGAAKAVAPLSFDLDADGVLRAVPLALLYYDAIFPSFFTQACAQALNVPQSQIKLDFGRGLEIGALHIPTSREGQVLPHFYASQQGQSAFSVDAFYDVLAGKIPATKYRDKIVLVGVTAAGLGDTVNTPVEASISPVQMTAQVISALLEQHLYRSPMWAPWFGVALVLLVAAYLILILPRLRARAGAMSTTLILAVLLVIHYALMRWVMLWLPLMAPACLLVLGHLALTTKRFLLTEAKEEKSSAESAESNRMLGLALQNQGQLDMAFDKLRRVPLDEGMMEVMYNLALDFERKRQFNKAESVYRLMYAHDAKYRDLAEKMKSAKQISETVLLGGGQSGGTLILDGGEVAKPMLGRYQLEKELGKGAMGVVYLGKDPKISRDVAIKTMSLSQEFDEDLIDQARERFFREAETAGRLNHPNIVTIFDAGEEHDLAYIAMEFLAGEDLTPYTKAGHLLPMLEAITIVRQIAQALDYAHQAGVVHRDIKPANVMYDRKTKTMKVTDFGIARITDSSKTKTGMVLGTPSFMSPEQLAGKHIDGRSDLFSLGVMLYQMLTGYLPFVGNSMAELMYRITQQPPTDPRNYNPKIPSVLIKIMMKALEKNVDERFQSGAKMAAVLMKLEEAIKGAAHAKSVGRT
ncbi:CHASE2 domain-containing protein [Chitinibacter bivalviorum]|uniref:non-specific serine/threonine protein kinase n=1 Tax=Chitinibacter bivalviorum TaxID=2739434 RepID=A0A7H9BEM8_9NEIS|nr:serine/threonine-protein kinase [Chitinibacter bivalviorum]QLG87079.1 CHASE2 domain-containing protein [Chitinibacter bivalviorum]